MLNMKIKPRVNSTSQDPKIWSTLRESAELKVDVNSSRVEEAAEEKSSDTEVSSPPSSSEDEAPCLKYAVVKAWRLRGAEG